MGRRHGYILPTDPDPYASKQETLMSQQESTNPKDKIGKTKPALHLIPGTAQVQEAVVMKLGADKYGPYNWRGNTVSASVYVAAALRHLHSWFDGENLDKESNASHLAHARACLGILLDAEVQGMLVDDRPETGKTADLIQLETILDQANKQEADSPLHYGPEETPPTAFHNNEHGEDDCTSLGDPFYQPDEDAVNASQAEDHIEAVNTPWRQPNVCPSCRTYIGGMCDKDCPERQQRQATFQGVPVQYVRALGNLPLYFDIPHSKFRPLEKLVEKAVESEAHLWYTNPAGECSQTLCKVEEPTPQGRMLAREEYDSTVDALRRRGCDVSVAKTLAAGITVPRRSEDVRYEPIGDGSGERVPCVYVAGPMRGYDKHNFPAFDEARDHLIGLDYVVFSPADIDRASGVNENTETSCTPAESRSFAYRDFNALHFLDAEHGDAIAMLPGWERSTGAVAEFFLARWLGLKVINAETGGPLSKVHLDMHYGACDYALGR